MIYSDLIEEYYYKHSANIANLGLLKRTMPNRLLQIMKRTFDFPEGFDDEKIIHLLSTMDFMEVNPLNLKSIKIGSKDVQEKLTEKSISAKEGIKLKDIEDSVEEFLLTEHIMSAGLDNALIAIVMNYENFISSLFSVYFKDNPKKIESKVTIDSSNICCCKNVEEIIDRLIEVDVGNIMFMKPKEMHARASKCMDNSEFFEKKKKKIFEIFARRNCLMHNNSILNSQYLDNTENIYKLKKGDNLTPSFDYINEASDILFVQGFLMFVSLWKNIDSSKIDKKEIDNTNNSIERIAWKFLCKEKWECTYFMYKIMKDVAIFEENSECFLLNYFLSGKHIDDKTCLKEIQKYSFYSRETIYKVGYLGMICDYDKLLEVIKAENFKDEDGIFMAWPIFSDLRKKDPDKFQLILKSAL